jgi:hypothetical protein
MMRSRSRSLLIVVAIAAVALGAGVFAGTRITSPAAAAARAAPREASEVTVPVERRVLESQIVTRGDASYTGAVKVELGLTGLETAAVVTGQVPSVGDTVNKGDVLLEVVGRPVIALPGDLPMYRSLRPGMSGPDVEQLEKALDELGFDPGNVDDKYTNSTGLAVAALFEKAGYEAPAVDAEIQEQLKQANEAVRLAEDEVATAQAALNGGLDEGPDNSAARAELDRAKQRLAEAQRDRDVVAAQAGTPLPSSEAVFLTKLPRRVDEVNVKRGGEVDGAVMSVSGTDLAVTAAVDAAGGELLEKGMPAVLELPTGDEVMASITKIREPSGDDGEYTVVITPEELTKEQVEALRGANVRVTIPVESTDGEVLAVPLAALTAGPGGETRVEVQRGAAGGATSFELVEVEVGLTAGGYAEITPVDGSLDEGDLVVVPQEAAVGDEAAADDDD